MSNNGYMVEAEIKNLFIDLGFEVNYEPNKYYDLEISKNGITKKIEIKSCQFQIYKEKNRLDYGRFDFTRPKNRTLQRTNNVIILFVVTMGKEYRIIGFRHSKTLGVDRYVTLKSVMNLRLVKWKTYLKKFK